MPFGQIHSGNPEIIALAERIGRTPSSVAMKLANFASLDPAITRTGRKGLEGASALDRAIWAEFNKDWTGAILDASALEEQQPPAPHALHESRATFSYEAPAGATTTRVEIEQRLGQAFFRRAVMANFSNACCVTGIADPRLLNASHIAPWKSDVANRHNPRNGLCLSATFDRAFDRYLMTVTPDLEVRISRQLLQSASKATRDYFTPYHGRALREATHLAPDPAFLRRHNAQFLS
ncbi:HNH endonuclease [Allosphingosinicella sp.]|uniref:HNH endonuclease n=1 Tax=Allosphingosinicella sp. TaxID=2823234 RepID=UPI003D73E32C